METLRGISGVPTETVEFVNLCPDKWKCGKCGVIVTSLWRINQITNNYHNNNNNANFNSNSLNSIAKNSFSPKSPSGSLSPFPCRHRFCSFCLKTLFSGTTAHETKCPFDGAVLRKSQMMEDPLSTQIILEQEVYCSHKSRGCKKVMQLSELEVHIRTCLYGLVHCPLKCGQGITIKSLPNHMANLCPRRVVSCQHCDEDIPLDSRNDHEKNCPKRPVTCTHCNNNSLVQNEMKMHLEKCPMKPRNCKLEVLGCNFSGTSVQVDEHESKWENHMDIVLKTILQNNKTEKARNRLGDVVAIVKDLNNENELLKERTNELTEKVESLASGNKALKDQLNKLETTHKADMASMKTLVEVLRKEIEALKVGISKLSDDDEDSEV